MTWYDDVATKKKLSASELRAKVLALKTQIYNLNDRYEETLILERLTDSQREDLNVMLQIYQRVYGPVQFHNWMRAVMRSMRSNFTDVGQVLIAPVLGRKHSDAMKKLFLEVMAKQMGVDVIVTLNKKKSST